MGILAAILFLLAVAALILFFKGKGIFETIAMFLFLGCAIALPILLTLYFKQLFAEQQTIWAPLFGLFLGLTLSFALCGFFTYRLRINWIKTAILTLFLIAGVATIICGVYLSKFYFVGNVQCWVTRI